MILNKEKFNEKWAKNGVSIADMFDTIIYLFEKDQQNTDEVKRLNDIIDAHKTELEKRSDSIKIKHIQRIAHKSDLDLLNMLLLGDK